MSLPRKCLAQAFCDRYGVPPERFEDAMLAKVLYPRARWVLFSLRKYFRRDYLQADREVVEDVGRASDLASIAAVLSRLEWYYGTSWNLRHELRLRVSSRRILAVAAEVGLSRNRRAARPGIDGSDPRLDEVVPVG